MSLIVQLPYTNQAELNRYLFGQCFESNNVDKLNHRYQTRKKNVFLNFLVLPQSFFNLLITSAISSIDGKHNSIDSNLL